MTPQENCNFRLYVAGHAPNSTLAESNLRALCRQYLASHYQIELVDVFREPQRALADGIFMTPTLVKLAPLPAPVKIVGSLNDRVPLMQALGLHGELE